MDEFIKGFMTVFINIGEVFTDINWHLIGCFCSIVFLFMVVLLIIAIIKGILD